MIAAASPGAISNDTPDRTRRGPRGVGYSFERSVTFSTSNFLPPKGGSYATQIRIPPKGGSYTTQIRIPPKGGSYATQIRVPPKGGNYRNQHRGYANQHPGP